MSVDLVELERRIRILEDVEAIKLLKARYAAACDRNYDVEAIAALFAKEAIWSSDLFGEHQGREAIREFFRGASFAIPFAMHYMINPIIQVEGDTATGEWHLFQTCTFAGEQAIFGAARYHEEYRRTDGEWLFWRLKLTSSFWTPYEDGWVKRRFVQQAREG